MVVGDKDQRPLGIDLNHINMINLPDEYTLTRQVYAIKSNLFNINKLLVVVVIRLQDMYGISDFLSVGCQIWRVS